MKQESLKQSTGFKDRCVRCCSKVHPLKEQQCSDGVLVWVHSVNIGWVFLQFVTFGCEKFKMLLELSLLTVAQTSQFCLLTCNRMPCPVLSCLFKDITEETEVRNYMTMIQSVLTYRHTAEMWTQKQNLCIWNISIEKTSQCFQEQMQDRMWTLERYWTLMWILSKLFRRDDFHIAVMLMVWTVNTIHMLSCMHMSLGSDPRDDQKTVG